MKLRNRIFLHFLFLLRLAKRAAAQRAARKPATKGCRLIISRETGPVGIYRHYLYYLPPWKKEESLKMCRISAIQS